MKRFYIYYVILLAVLVTGCASQKVVDPNLPGWVVNQTSDPYYYVGVGFAPKQKGLPLNYEQATKEALRLLSSEIAVNIKSNSLLVSIEKDNRLNDDFSSIIEARVKNDLEGVEKVASYENKTGYWVYYRLSKNQYALQQSKKRQAAVDKAMTFYYTALNSEQTYDIKTAIINYARSLDAVKAYFNEQVMVNTPDGPVDLVQTAYQKLSNLFAAIKIVSSHTQLDIKSGTRVPEQFMECQVFFNEVPIKFFPLQIAYSERILQNQVQTSNANGTASFVAPLVTSKKSTETITFTIDKTAILTESAVDYAIRRWLSNVYVNEAVLSLYVLPPTIYVRSIEQNLGLPMSGSPVYDQLKSKWLASGYRVTTDPETADFILTIETNTARSNCSSGMCTAILSSSISVKNKQGNTLFSTYVNNVRGTHLNLQDAGVRCYEEFVRQLNMRYFKEIESAIMK